MALIYPLSLLAILLPIVVLSSAAPSDHMLGSGLSRILAEHRLRRAALEKLLKDRPATIMHLFQPTDRSIERGRGAGRAFTRFQG